MSNDRRFRSDSQLYRNYKDELFWTPILHHTPHHRMPCHHNKKVKTIMHVLSPANSNIKRDLQCDIGTHYPVSVLIYIYSCLWICGYRHYYFLNNTLSGGRELRSGWGISKFYFIEQPKKKGYLSKNKNNTWRSSI